MALAPGTRLGSYEVTALIGSGGMGEVSVRFRAPSKNTLRQCEHALEIQDAADCPVIELSAAQLRKR